MKKQATSAKARAFGILRSLAEALEIVVIFVGVIAVCVYTTTTSHVRIALGGTGDCFVLSGSSQVLSPVTGVRASESSTMFQQVYEVPLPETDSLSISSEDLASTFTEEVSDLAQLTSRDHVSATVDRDGFLVVYDPAEKLDIVDDIPVFVVPLGDSSGYVFGFTPTTN